MIAWQRHKHVLLSEHPASDCTHAWCICGRAVAGWSLGLLCDLLGLLLLLAGLLRHLEFFCAAFWAGWGLWSRRSSAYTRRARADGRTGLGARGWTDCALLVLTVSVLLEWPMAGWCNVVLVACLGRAAGIR